MYSLVLSISKKIPKDPMISDYSSFNGSRLYTQTSGLSFHGSKSLLGVIFTQAENHRNVFSEFFLL